MGRTDYSGKLFCNWSTDAVILSSALPKHFGYDYFKAYYPSPEARCWQIRFPSSPGLLLKKNIYILLN